MGNPLLGQILASAVGRQLSPGAAPASANQPGGTDSAPTGGFGGALGGLLGGLVGRGAGAAPGNGVLLATVLPLAMRWVQSNGGIGAVLQRFHQKGLGPQADSWVAPGENHRISAEDAQRVVGTDETRRLASQLGVPEQEVSQAFAEILPELADKLTPQGTVHPQAEAALDSGANALETMLGELHADTQHSS